MWEQQKEYIELWCEKDAIVGVIEEITREYDVMVRPLRGYSSLTFIHHAAEQLKEITKPITIYYLGDHDPSGYDIERSSRASLNSMMGWNDVLFDFGLRRQCSKMDTPSCSILVPSGQSA